VLDALDFVKAHQRARKETLPSEIDVSFMSHRWQAFVLTRLDGQRVLKRRELEITVFSHVADGLRCGDLYVCGSDEYADYRQQLLPWEECEKRLDAYCQVIGLPNKADAFVEQLKSKLTDVGQTVDAQYPSNTELIVDESGRPHLKRLRSTPQPTGLDQFLETVRNRMPERHLLDILKHVHYWSNYTRHFTPPAGSDPKMPDATARYLFTLFGYGCNLGAAGKLVHDGALWTGLPNRSSCARKYNPPYPQTDQLSTHHNERDPKSHFRRD
jgi:hypothetical protein